MGSLTERYSEQQAAREAELRQRALTQKRLLIGLGAVGGVVILALLVWQFSPPSAEERYKADLHKIRTGTLVFTAAFHPEAPKAGSNLGDGGFADSADLAEGRQPSFANARVGTGNALKEADAGNLQITTLGVEQTNPTGGKDRGGTPSWEDTDGNGKRTPGNEVLFHHNADPPPTVDHWNTTTVVHKDTAYVVDSRDWFIDMDMMVTKWKLLKAVPKSASPDNSATGTGSYSWYIDENGEIKSMLYSYPVPEQTGGFQDVYP